MKTWVARFWSKVNVRGDDDCWFWRAEKNADGYGMFTVDGGGPVYAHATAYLLFYGVLPPGLYPWQVCGRSACCNPKHLYVSSKRENAVKKRRGGPPRKLSPARIMLLHDEYKNGCKQYMLAKKYGISKSTVSRLLRSRDA